MRIIVDIVSALETISLLTGFLVRKPWVRRPTLKVPWVVWKWVLPLKLLPLFRIIFQRWWSALHAARGPITSRLSLALTPLSFFLAGQSYLFSQLHLHLKRWFHAIFSFSAYLASGRCEWHRCPVVIILDRVIPRQRGSRHGLVTLWKVLHRVLSNDSCSPLFLRKWEVWILFSHFVSLLLAAAAT